jgi:cell filamentation protein
MIYTINMHALKNRLGITNKRELEEAENAAMATAFNELLGMYEAPHKFTSADIRMVHKAWLGGIYEWAGEYRQVDVRKEDISFAPAKQIPPLMDALERGALQRHTPCNFRSANRVTQALAEVHVELIIIHPFPGGNGRVARILASLMASQAGLPILDFRDIIGKKKSEYFSAIHRGLYGDYNPMDELFAQIILMSVKARFPRRC